MSEPELYSLTAQLAALNTSEALSVQNLASSSQQSTHDINTSWLVTERGDGGCAQ